MRYQIEIGSPTDYEKLVAYIIIDDIYFALLNQDNGSEKIVVEFLDVEKLKKVDFFVLTDALTKAKKLLIQ